MGSKSVENVLRATELDTVFKRLELRDEGVSHMVQLSACKELLTRRRGNVPIRSMNEENEFGGDVRSRVSHIDLQLKALKAQQVKQQGNKENEQSKCAG